MNVSFSSDWRSAFRRPAGRFQRVVFVVIHAHGFIVTMKNASRQTLSGVRDTNAIVSLGAQLRQYKAAPWTGVAQAFILPRGWPGQSVACRLAGKVDSAWFHANHQGADRRQAGA